MKRITRFKKRTWVLFGVVAVIAAMASVGAYAYWTAQGSGDGTATTDSVTANIVVNETTSASDLWPGGTPQALAGDFDNNNNGPVYIGTVTAVVDPLFDVVLAGHAHHCTAADFDIVGTGVVNAEIPTGPGVGSWSGITIQLKDLALDQDACQSQNVPLDYTLTTSHS